MSLKTELRSIVDLIIADVQKTYDIRYSNLRVYYGHFFFLASCDMLEVPYCPKSILHDIEQLNINSKEFHWEFVKYAMTHNNKQTNKNPILSKINNKNSYNWSKATNWQLLNLLVRLKRKEISKIPLKYTLMLSMRQERSGFIRDAFSVRSSQYHAFSTSLLFEIYKITKSNFILKRFFKAVYCLRNMTLTSGEFNYMGRGQFQSFGYGPAIYSLIAAFNLTKESFFYDQAKKIIALLQRYQIDTGEIPLVTGSDIVYENYSLKSVKHSGWYPYNNYFDYYGFLNFFLVKAIKLEEEFSPNLQRQFKQHHKSLSRHLMIKKQNSYDAIVSRPFGYWTNGLAVPYVESKNKRLTPVVGGEQFQDSLYKPFMNSLPTFSNKSMKILWSSIFLNTLFILSLKGILIRRYTFSESSIDIRSYNLFFGQWEDNYSFIGDIKVEPNLVEIKKDNFSAIVHGENLKVTNGFSASGPIKVIRCFKCKFIKNIQLKLGDPNEQ